MLDASLFSSLPTVSGPSVYGISVLPSGEATTGVSVGEEREKTKVSSKKAFRIVAPAPANAACPAGYAGCVGLPSG
jgi:hypothetical protein